VRRAAAAIAVSMLAVLTACNADKPAASGGAATSANAAPPAQVQVSPKDGSADLSPTTPLEISVTGGELEDVTVVDGSGASVPGKTAAATGSASSEVWTPDTQLAYGTSYTVTATAKNADDKEATAKTTFSTVTPETQTTPSIGPLDGTTVGVGMPIRVYFDQPVTDKAAVESHLKVTSSNPTDGAWNWLSDSEVHFRPSKYWPAHTDVTLDAQLYGVDFGDGVWGEKNRTVHFTVGERHVSIADAATHQMVVYDGDKVVQTWPMSAGSQMFPSHNGVHVVTELNRERIMDSSTFGVPVNSPHGYRTKVEFAVRISNNGEFVHAAPWSVAQQGHANVSHGCINVSTERAAWFYNFSQAGDVVEIKNSIGPDLGPQDGDIYDWTIPWDQWQAGSALK
jgi:lipoprotein-anchoring transpeptidase ErfK/SrfK